MEKRPVICYYHAECLDGFTSAWIVKSLYPEAELIPVTYGEDVPALPMDSLVFVVDFTFPDPDFMYMLVDHNETVVHLDHHISAVETHEWLKEKYTNDHYIGVFDMDRSGAGITWDTLVGEKRPHIVNFVEDRDLWRFKYPETQFFTEGLMQIDKTMEAWDWAQRKENAEWLMTTGKETYEKRLTRCGSQLEKTAIPIEVPHNDQRLPALFSFLEWPSDSSTQTQIALQHEDYEIALAAYVQKDGSWKVRVTTTEEGPPANEVAKAFHPEGGGHLRAGGFVLKAEELGELKELAP